MSFRSRRPPVLKSRRLDGYHYPVSVAGSSCVSDIGHIYCVGGNIANAVYSAPISAAGIGAWTLQTNNYPTNIYLPSCALATISSVNYIFSSVVPRRLA